MKLRSPVVLGFAGMAILAFLVSLAFLIRGQSNPWAGPEPDHERDENPPATPEVVATPPRAADPTSKPRVKRFPDGFNPRIKRPSPPEPPAKREPIKVNPADKPTFDPAEPFSAEKTLAAGDRAYINSNLDETQKYYEEFELIYAGSAEYDRKAEHVWERLGQVYDARGRSEITIREHLEARKGLQQEWLRIKVLVKERSAAEVRGELKGLLANLPPRDGRIAIITSWLEKAGSEK